jgi:hypothetical protein
MRKTDRSWVVCGLLLLLLVACGPSEQDETPSPTAAASATIPPTETPEKEASPTRTAQPRPTNTRVFQLPAIGETTRALDPGWRRVGDERFGLQVAVPVEWVEATPQLRMSDLIDRFGPQMILVTSNAETADRLLTGEPFEQGALIFGFTADSIPPNLGAEEALSDLLAEADSEGLAPISVEGTQVGGMPAAYVDLTYDPLGIFASYPESMRFRVLTVISPELRNPAVFIIGAPADEWIANSDTFVTISDLIFLSETSSNVFEHMVAGDTVQGSLDGALDNIWTFTADEGNFATISLTPEDENVDLTLTLIDPAGNVLLTVDDGYAGEAEVLRDIPLPESGTYLIEASEFFNEPGRYRLGLLLSDEAEFESGGLIEFGQEISAELVPDNRHSWFFQGTAGQEATVILTSLDETFDVILELRSPDDRPIAVLDEGFVGDAEIIAGQELPLTGQYAIIVRGFAGHGGMYTLALDEGGESTANFFDVGDLVYGDVRQETLRKDEAHAWFFNGRLGTEVTIEATPLESTMDLDIWLLDPDLQELVMRDEHLSGETERIEYKLPLTGQYLILVREFFGEPGRYELSLNAGGVDELEIAGTIVYSETATGILESGRRAAWSFNGEMDDIIDIVLSPLESDRDLVLLLVDPAGNAAITVDAALADSPEKLVGFRLTSSGEWKIVVKEFFNEGSEYDLLLTRRELDDPQTE